MMPFEPGTRGFALGAAAGGAALAAASLYVVRGEWGRRDALGLKLLAASIITFAFGAGLSAWAVVFCLCCV